MATGIGLWDTASVMQQLRLRTTDPATIAQYDSFRRTAEKMILSYVKWPILGVAGSVDYYDGSGYKDMVLRYPFTSSIASVYLDNTGAYGQGPNAFPAQSLLVSGTDYALVLDGGSGSTPGQVSKSALLRRLTNNAYWFPSDLVFYRGAGGLGYRKPAFWPSGYGNLKVTSNWGFTAATVITNATWVNGTLTITTSTPHLLWQGQDCVTITGANPSAINVDYYVQGVISATQFTVALAANPGAYVSGGTINSVPFDIQGALAQIVGIIRNTSKWGGLITSESGGDWNGSLSISMDPQFGTVRQMLAPYRNVSMIPSPF